MFVHLLIAGSLCLLRVQRKQFLGQLHLQVTVHWGEVIFGAAGLLDI